MKKRISNRRYPPRTCKKSDCGEVFIPTNKKQVYCCAQHRIDHNNDIRDIKAQPVLELDKKLAHNQKVLEKIFTSSKRFKTTSFNLALLEYEGFNFNSSTDITINSSTSKEIHWNYHYGLETYDKTNLTFIIHHRSIINYGTTNKISNN